MNDSTVNNHFKKILLAVFFAPLMLVPVGLILIFIGGIVSLLSADSYNRLARLFSHSDMFMLLYMVGVASLITLLYGVPVYLLLKRFKLANIYTLSAAGFIVLVPIGGVYLGLSGAFVAACFWLIVAPYNHFTRQKIRIGAMVFASIAGTTLLLGELAEAWYHDEISNYVIARNLDRNAPLPGWWESVSVESNIETIDDARRMHAKLQAYGSASEQQQLENRQFFKAAYMALSNVKRPIAESIELVTLMDIPFVDYPQMFELQKYTLSIYPTDSSSRLSLLGRMLSSYDATSSEHGYARSLSYDMIVENNSSNSIEVMAQVCQQLAHDYNGWQINNFEISVFKRCVVQLRQYQGAPEIKAAVDEISGQLEWMERVFSAHTGAAASD